MRRRGIHVPPCRVPNPVAVRAADSVSRVARTRSRRTSAPWTRPSSALPHATHSRRPSERPRPTPSRPRPWQSQPRCRGRSCHQPPVNAAYTAPRAAARPRLRCGLRYRDRRRRGRTLTANHTGRVLRLLVVSRFSPLRHVQSRAAHPPPGLRPPAARSSLPALHPAPRPSDLAPHRTGGPTQSLRSDSRLLA